MVMAGQIELPLWAWQRPALREALRRRDVGALLRTAQAHGYSQSRLAAATGLSQPRINEIVKGHRTVTALEVFERVAEGLAMPPDARHLLGLATGREAHTGGAAFDLDTFPEVVRVYDAQAAAAAEIQAQAQRSAEVDVLAVRGLGLLALNSSLLRSPVLRATARLRVLLLDPGSPALARRAAEIGETSESLAEGIVLAEARLREMAATVPVEVYRYRALPTWRIIRCDEVLYLSAFTAGWEGHESPVYKVVQTANGPLYQGMRRMLDAMFDDSARTV
jgi:transcriptional regulator with XRE-family HTH domain